MLPMRAPSTVRIARRGVKGTIRLSPWGSSDSSMAAGKSLVKNGQSSKGFLRMSQVAFPSINVIFRMLAMPIACGYFGSTVNLILPLCRSSVRLAPPRAAHGGGSALAASSACAELSNACAPQLFESATIQSISNLDATRGMIEQC